MAKYYGRIGFIVTEETTPGVWTEVPTEVYYTGELQKVTRRWQGTERLNDDLVINSTISIIADSYAMVNFPFIRYAEYMGVLWKVTEVTPEFPRLTLSLGGVYNGD